MSFLRKNALIVGAIALISSQAAYAGGLYVYVDEQGVPHYALQALDERYKLFNSDGPVLSDDVKVVSSDLEMRAKLPDMSVYGKNAAVPAMRMPNGIVVAAPSKSTLSRLLNNASMKRYEPIIARHARSAGVDINLVKAIMAAESGFNSAAVSPKNAQGLMQVIPPTAARYGVTEAQLMNPERNIYAGVRYLGDLSRMFKGRPELVIAAYNAGEGAVYKYKRSIPPYQETQNYVRTVLQFYSVYSPTGSLNVGGAVAQTQSTGNRRSVQRVNMKIGGRLKMLVNN